MHNALDNPPFTHAAANPNGQFKNCLRSVGSRCQQNLTTWKGGKSSRKRTVWYTRSKQAESANSTQEASESPATEPLSHCSRMEPSMVPVCKPPSVSTVEKSNDTLDLGQGATTEVSPRNPKCIPSKLSPLRSANVEGNQRTPCTPQTRPHRVSTARAGNTSVPMELACSAELTTRM